MQNRRKTTLPLMFAALLVLSTAVSAQLPPAADVLPAGFTVTGERNLGGSIFISATKPNENFPKPHMDQGITLEITWRSSPMADMVLDMAAKQPEDPAVQIPGSMTREEPCGTERYHDGVLKCRKVSERVRKVDAIVLTSAGGPPYPWLAKGCARPPLIILS